MFSSVLFKLAQFENHTKSLNLGIGEATVRYAVSLETLCSVKKPCLKKPKETSFRTGEMIGWFRASTLPEDRVRISEPIKSYS